MKSKLCISFSQQVSRVQSVSGILFSVLFCLKGTWHGILLLHLCLTHSGPLTSFRRLIKKNFWGDATSYLYQCSKSYVLTQRHCVSFSLQVSGLDSVLQSVSGILQNSLTQKWSKKWSDTKVISAVFYSDYRACVLLFLF